MMQCISLSGTGSISSVSSLHNNNLPSEIICMFTFIIGKEFQCFCHYTFHYLTPMTYQNIFLNQNKFLFSENSIVKCHLCVYVCVSLCVCENVYTLVIFLDNVKIDYGYKVILYTQHLNTSWYGQYLICCIRPKFTCVFILYSSSGRSTNYLKISCGLKLCCHGVILFPKL